MRLTRLALCFLLISAPSRPAAALDERLADVETFAFALGASLDEETLARLAEYDLAVIDGEDASPDFVAALRSQGTLVLGYLAVGTIEKGRSWFKKLKPFRLELWSDWDEWYADVNNPRCRRIFLRQIAPALLEKGFDGLFLDNVDMIDTHRRQRRGMHALVRGLGKLVHGRAGLLFAQNGDDVITPLVPFLDGWNREDVTLAYDFDKDGYTVQPDDEIRRALETLRRLREAGLFVTATDYRGDEAGDLDQTALTNACSVGAVPYIADIDLTRMPEVPYRCGQ